MRSTSTSGPSLRRNREPKDHLRTSDVRYRIPTPLGALALRGVLLLASGILFIPTMAGAGPAGAATAIRAAAATTAAAAAVVHEVPAAVTVQAFVKADGQVLRLLVRAPLGAMRDLPFPTRGVGFLSIAESQEMLVEAVSLWLVEYVSVFEDDELLTDPVIAVARASLPSDTSFRTYETALASLLGPPLPDETDIYWQQALIDTLIEYPIESADSRFSIEPQWAHLGMTTSLVLAFELPSGESRPFHFLGNPGLVRLDPSWYQAALTFVRMGIVHLLDGIEHLLFIFCLVIPFRRLVPLLAIVASFGLGLSITLIASAFGFAPISLWFPPLVEMLLAISIVLVAFENIVGPKLQRRSLLAFGFGLAHGLGFSLLLRNYMQLAGSHTLTSLLSYNAGLEAAQVGALLLFLPVSAALFRWVVVERLGIILFSALIGHSAWHWTAARWETFRAYPLQLPPPDAFFLLALMRWLTAILILVGVAWGILLIFERFEGFRDEEPATPA